MHGGGQSYVIAFLGWGAAQDAGPAAREHQVATGDSEPGSAARPSERSSALVNGDHQPERQQEDVVIAAGPVSEVRPA